MKNVSINGDCFPPPSHIQEGSIAPKDIKTSFGDFLKDAVREVNKLQIEADTAIAKVELSNSNSIHEAIIALEKANISFRTMMQVRNKIITAYQEVMRMQV